jgi:hypothetical protein
MHLGVGFVSSISGSAWRRLFTLMHLASASFVWILEGTILVMGIPGVCSVEVGAQNSIMTIEHPDDRIGGIWENRNAMWLASIPTSATTMAWPNTGRPGDS